MMPQILTQAVPTKPDPPPCTPESAAAARLAADRERAEVAKHWIDESAVRIVNRLGLPLATVSDLQWDRVDGIEALALLIEHHGAERVQRWLTNLIALKGIGVQ